MSDFKIIIKKWALLVKECEPKMRGSTNGD